jgi:hypothetical protein
LRKLYIETQKGGFETASKNLLRVFGAMIESVWGGECYDALDRYKFYLCSLIISCGLAFVDT